MLDTDLGLLKLRIVIGAAVAAHGAQKVFGLFGGPGLKGNELSTIRAVAIEAAACHVNVRHLLVAVVTNPTLSLL